MSKKIEPKTVEELIDGFFGIIPSYEKTSKGETYKFHVTTTENNVEHLKDTIIKFLSQKFDELIKSLQKELERLSSLQCKTPDEATEQRIKLEQIHVEITHLNQLKKSVLGGKG